jgi:oligogalacturonide lyase
MIPRSITSVAFILWLLSALATSGLAQDEPPVEWIEPQTGHRVVRLSVEPDSQSLYFHQYPFSADGKKMVFTRRDGIYGVDLHTREIEHVVDGSVRILVTGRKTGDVYYIRRGGGRGRRDDSGRERGRGFWGGGDVYAANLDTHAERHVARLPEEFGGGNVAVNADETLIVAIGRDPDGKATPRTPPDGRFEGRLIPNWASGAPRLLYTIDIASGETSVIHRSNEWLNHLQCSPTDPQQIMFCHEGPWHYVDRVWLIRADGTGLTSIHPRTMDMEIAGHEFFNNDGRAVWYDLQTPRSLVFWLARYDIESKARTWYHLERNEWSVHFNISPDGTLIAGDGGGPNSVANLNVNHERLEPSGNGQWIYLFRPQLAAVTGLPEAAAGQVKPGMLRSERLVDLSKHDYSLEPNVIFTPDGKWVVFRSNMHGPTHVYMVEVATAR